MDTRQTSAPARGRHGTDRRALWFERALWVALAALFMALAACGRSDAAPPEHRGDAAHDTAPDAAGQGQHATVHRSAGHAEDAGAPGSSHDATAHRTIPAAEPSDFSVYHVESTWTDQTGTERPLRSLAGRVQVVAMVYTSCAYACPRIMVDMKRIEGDLGPDLGDGVGFVLVSIDPERDTPERLASFAAGSRLDSGRWTLLTADEGDILELAALLGVQYRETAPGEWVHSNLITVLNRQGEVVHRQLGLGTDPAETLAVIRAEIG
ncbi:MAG: SCO family protein [Gemmatimonadota bacterium]